MDGVLITRLSSKDKKVFFVLSLSVVALVMLSLVQDLLRSCLRNIAFYFSESFMFSTFWWLFAPLLFAQYITVRLKENKHVYFQLIVFVLPIILHLFAFPFLVWVLSVLFYYHTFALRQTLQYTLSEHLFQLVIMYSVPVLACQYITKKSKPAAKIFISEMSTNANHFMENILVAEGARKHSVVVSEVLFFTASPPYISIHLDDKKYLHNCTLKSISPKLNPEHFVRVHKSTIVNIKMVASYSSRLNGDYDLKMINDVTLRLSRNFAADFKNMFAKSHHLTTK